MKAIRCCASFAVVLMVAAVCFAQKPELVVQTGHSSSVSAVAFSPDAKMLASGSNDNTIKLWDVATGRELRTFSGHSRGVNSVAFSPEGKLLASGSDDKTIKVWELATGRELRTLAGHSKTVTAVAFSPDGRTLASASGFDSGNRSADPIRLWNVNTGEEVRALAHSAGVQGVNTVAFSARGNILASGGDDRKIKLWDTANARELRTLEGHLAAVSSVAFSVDDKTLASGSEDKTTRLWDLATGTELRSLAGHAESVVTVAFSPDGRALASGSGNILTGDSMIKVWVATSGQELHTFTGHSGPATSVAFSSDGKTFAGGTGNINGPSIVKLWDVATWEPLRVLTGNAGWVQSVAISTDGKMLASGNDDKTITLWDLTLGAKRFTLRHTSRVESVAFSPDGRILASGGGDKVIKLWDVATGRELASLVGHTGPIVALGFSSDGKILASSSYDKSIRLWDVATRREIKALAGGTAESGIAFSPDGRLLAGGSSDDSAITIWEVASGNVVKTLAGPEYPITSIAFSPDGRTLASGCNDTTVRIWDAATGRQSRILTGHSGFVSSVAFSADGRTLASSSWDKTVRLWDTTSGKHLRTLTGHSDVVSSVAFIGEFLVTGCADSTIKLWRQDGPLATLISLDNDWVVVTPESRFDTNKNLDSIEGLHWMMPDAPFSPLPLEIFMRDYYEPQLLARLMTCTMENRCEREFKPVRDIAQLNIVQPTVEINSVSTPDADGYVNVTMQIARGEGRFLQAGKEITRTSDLYDLRLFRNGQMVAYWPQQGSDKLEEQFAKQLRRTDLSDEVRLLQEESDWRQLTKVALDSNGRKTLTARVRLPAREDVSSASFTAYAFNESRVKTRTAKWIWPANVVAKLSPPRNSKARAYIITVGVNASENPSWRLQYAVNDALKLRDTLSESFGGLRLSKKNDQYDLIAIPLVSYYRADNVTLEANDATKPKIRGVIDLLAGRKPDGKVLSELYRSIPILSQMRKAEPDDLVLISFSSHGYSDRDGNFFLLPYDIGPSSQVTPELLLRCISSEELSVWLRDVDAGEIVMIIDACHAAALAGRDFKPGPMGSRGLGQLAYDKGMRILTATQANNFALESGALSQGLLSYALVENGLKQRRADFRPIPDGKITLKEWLEYGVAEVPALYERIRSGQLKVVGDGARAIIATAVRRDNSLQQRPALFDYARKQSDLVISVIGSSAP